MIKSISAKIAKELIDRNPSINIIDVREQWEYKKAKLDNAQLFPLRKFHKQLSLLNPDEMYLIYCHHGSRSFLACAFLIQQGFKQVYNLDGGIDAWSRDVDKRIPIY